MSLEIEMTTQTTTTTIIEMIFARMACESLEIEIRTTTIIKIIFTRSACESPESAKDLLSAAKMWKKMHAIINVSRMMMI